MIDLTVCPHCGASMRLSTRNAHGELAVPVAICTNVRCETARVLRG